MEGGDRQQKKRGGGEGRGRGREGGRAVRGKVRWSRTGGSMGDWRIMYSTHFYYVDRL